MRAGQAFAIPSISLRACFAVYKIPEEKQTDVNIAKNLLTKTMKDEYDTAVIISGDSDLMPGIKAVKTTFPAKRIGVAIPTGRNTQELINITDFHIRIKERHLRTSVFPNKINIDGYTLVCPEDWK